MISIVRFLLLDSYNKYRMNFDESSTLWLMWYQWFKGVRILWTRILRNKLNCLEFYLTGQIMMSIKLRGPNQICSCKICFNGKQQGKPKKLKRGPKSDQSKGSPAVPLYFQTFWAFENKLCSSYIFCTRICKKNLLK